MIFEDAYYGEIPIDQVFLGETLIWKRYDDIGDLVYDGVDIPFAEDTNTMTGTRIAIVTLPKAIKPDKTYIVIWDGAEYTCTARGHVVYELVGYNIKFNFYNMLGNAPMIYKIWDQSATTTVGSTGEPFVFCAAESGSTNYQLRTLSTNETHTIKIYEAK